MLKNNDEMLSQWLNDADFKKRVTAICKTIDQGRGKAEDLEQEVYLRFSMVGRTAFRGDADIYTYIFKIARNIYIDGVRREKRVNKKTNITLPGGQEDDTARRASLKQALGQLTARQRQILILKAKHGANLEHIAQKLSMSKSQAHRELKFIQKALLESIESWSVTWNQLQEATQD